MHELGIAFHIVSEIEKICAANNVKQVKSVTLEIGEVSSVVPEYLQDVWKWACENKSTHMKGCELNIVRIAAVSFCENCKQTYPTKSGRVCPHCGGKDTYLVQGNETRIKNIEVVDS